MRSSPSGTHPHAQASVATKSTIPPHFYGDVHKKTGAPQPISGVSPGPPRYLASPPLHTPPSTQTPRTPPPAHHNSQVELRNALVPFHHLGGCVARIETSGKGRPDGSYTFKVRTNKRFWEWPDKQLSQFNITDRILISAEAW